MRKLTGLLIGAFELLYLTIAVTLMGPPLFNSVFPPKPGESFAVIAQAERLLYPILTPLKAVVLTLLPRITKNPDAIAFLAGVLMALCGFALARLLRVARETAFPESPAGA